MKNRLRRPSLGTLRSLLASATYRPGNCTGVCLIIDADRTLAPQDTGRLVGRVHGVDDAIRATFEKYGYVEEAFSVVSALWARVPPDVYLAAVERVCTLVTIRPEWISVLAAAMGRSPVVIVTSGIPQVWRSVLTMAGLGAVPVIGGCHRDLDEYIVCPDTKANLVGVFQEAGWRVLAAGDSRIDLPMLRLADVPLFVPDHKGSPGLREHLCGVPKIRHLIIDDQRFDDLRSCTAQDVVALIETGVWCNAD